MSKKELIRRAIELCLGVYRVADKFPPNEILKGKLRSASLDIVEGMICDLKSSPTHNSRFFNFKKFEVLFAYFEIAARQRWVKAENFDFLAKEYQILYDSAKARIAQAEAVEKPATDHSKRQRSIMQFLEERKEGGNLTDMAKNLKLSKRAINRELTDLIAQGIVKKQGVTKGAKFISALFRHYYAEITPR